MAEAPRLQKRLLKASLKQNGDISAPDGDATIASGSNISNDDSIQIPVGALLKPLSDELSDEVQVNDFHIEELVKEEEKIRTYKEDRAVFSDKILSDMEAAALARTAAAAAAAAGAAAGAAPEDKEKQRSVKMKEAKKYRQLFLLPRYVVEKDGTKRKLEAGEVHAESKLYSIFTSIEDLGAFGIGVGLYFKTLIWLGILLAICALIQMPTVNYFQSKEYDESNKYDLTIQTIGSAACLAEMRVCLDVDCLLIAGEFQYPRINVPRYDPKYKCDAQECPWRDGNFKISPSDLGSELYPFNFASVSKEVGDPVDQTTVGKRLCKLKRWFGTADFIMMIFVCATLLLLGWRQDREAEDLDLSEQTAQDYSVMISDPNPEITDPDEWKEFFEKNFGPVFLVTVTLNNCNLLRLYKKKRFLENEMRLEAIEEERFVELAREHATETGEGNNRESITSGQKEKTFFKQTMEAFGFDKTLPYFVEQHHKIEQEISSELRRHAKEGYKASKVFVTFNSEQSQRACLEAMCVGRIPAALDWKMIEEKYIFKGNLLHILEAPEPSSIQYEYLDRGFVEHTFEQVVSWTVVSGALILTYFTVVACFDGGQPLLGAIMISFWNGLIPEINRFLAQEYEMHHTQDDIESSFLAKTICARWFTSSIVLYLVGLDHSQYILSPYYISSVQAVLLADAITSPIVRLIDGSGLFKRHILAPMSGTDLRARTNMEGTDWLLAERYSDIAKSVLMSMFFSAIMPTGYWYSAFACICAYWVDKFCLLRIFRMKPPCGDRLVRLTRTTIAMVVLVHTVITAHFYFAWPFDNLCPSNRDLSDAGFRNAEIAGVGDLKVWEQCKQVSNSLLPPVGKQIWFQEGDDQTNLVAFFNICSILMIIYLLVAYFGADSALGIYGLFYFYHEPVGRAFDIPFSKVETGEGYVPQFSIVGFHHAIMACCAPAREQQHRENAKTKEKSETHFNAAAASCAGGLEFEPYLLNWQPMDEKVQEMTEENKYMHMYHSKQHELTQGEKDKQYRDSNIYFDIQIQESITNLRVSGLSNTDATENTMQHLDAAVDVECLDVTSPALLLGRVKQYITFQGGCAGSANYKRPGVAEELIDLLGPFIGEACVKVLRYFRFLEAAKMYETETRVAGCADEDGTTCLMLEAGNPQLGVVSEGCRIKVHCTIKLATSSSPLWTTKRNECEPFEYQVGAGDVLFGWDKGCIGMAVNETRFFKIPAKEAFGRRGRPGWGIPGEVAVELTLTCIEIVQWPPITLLEAITFRFWWVFGCGCI